jgi:hypothetical protein
MNNAEQPAFPDPMRGGEWNEANQQPYNLAEGLSKREYAAIKILSGMVAGYDGQSKTNGRYIPISDYPDMAKSAVQLADALLKELSAPI